MKEMKDLYSKNHKSLKKEIEEDNRRRVSHTHGSAETIL
jgi:hypothetical protein